MTSHSGIISEVSATCNHADWSLWHKVHETYDQGSLGFWMRKTPDAAAEYTPFETVLSMLLGMEPASKTEGHKIILKPRNQVMTWVISEKHSDAGSAHNSSTA